MLGSVLFAWSGPKLPRYWTFAIAMLLVGAPPLLTLALTHNLIVLLVVCFVVGIASASLNPIISSAMFERVPEKMRARVFGFSGSLAWAGIPLGGLIAGVMVDHYGRTTGILIAAGVYLIVTLSPLLTPGLWREMDRAPSEAR